MKRRVPSYTGHTFQAPWVFPKFRPRKKPLHISPFHQTQWVLCFTNGDSVLEAEVEKSGAFLPILRPGPALSRPPPSRPVELVAFSRLIYTETSILANTCVELINCCEAFHGFNVS